MSLIDYYSPYREIEDFQKRARSLFGFNDSMSRVATPAVDVIENEDEFIFIADFPGFTKDEIEISAATDSLSIKAERMVENEENEEEDSNRYIKRERRNFKFSRTFNFAKPVNPEDAKVTLENGVLSITLPKSEEVKPKKLLIEGN